MFIFSAVDARSQVTFTGDVFWLFAKFFVHKWSVRPRATTFWFHNSQYTGWSLGHVELRYTLSVAFHVYSGSRQSRRQAMDLSP